MDVPNMRAYGTRVVAGVSPGKGGQQVFGVPVYDTVREAMGQHRLTASVVYVPAPAVRDAVLEAVEARISLVLVPTEGVPHHDAADVVAAARAAGVRIIGPNCNGLISPGECKLGGIGGDAPDEIYAPGSIGIISRSGGMSAEIAVTLKNAGYGVSTCVSIGGDLIIGTDPVECLRLFAADTQTLAVVYFGEPGTRAEQALADYLKRDRYPKPIVASISGEFQEAYPEGTSFGHASAMIQGKTDTATAKRRVLQEAGVLLVDRMSGIPEVLSAVLTVGPSIGRTGGGASGGEESVLGL